MSRFHKAVREGRRSRVPLARVVQEIRRSDRRLRLKAVMTACCSLLALIFASTAALYYKPWNTVLAASEPVPFSFAEAGPDATRIVIGFPPAAGPAPQATEQLASLRRGEDAGPAEPAVSVPAEPAPVVTAVDQHDTGPQNAGLQAVAVTVPPSAESEDAATALNGADRPETHVTSALPPLQAPMEIRVAAVNTAVQMDETLLADDAPMRCADRVRRLANDIEVYFPLSGVTIGPEYDVKLKEFAVAVTECPSIRVDVGGHTDKIGEQLMNLQLSWQRAENVIAHMKRLGLDTSRFSPVGFSSTRPKYTDPTVQAQPRNRRVEFVIR